jgi:hypothetical protein
MNEQQGMDEILRLAEMVSGKPVLVHADANLRLPSTMRMARGDAPAHLVLYQPALSAMLPYLVSFQCGFLIRLYRPAPDSRYDLTLTMVGRAEVDRLIREHFRRRKQELPRTAADQLRDQWLNGLGLQLRSIPVGMRVDSWIYQTYPVLRDQQRNAAVRQLNESAEALRENVRELSPPMIYDASVGMNAAFASFWARLWEEDHIASPYRLTIHSKSGEDLLKTFDDVSDQPEYDRTLIEAWGQRLKIISWFAFIPQK